MIIEMKGDDHIMSQIIYLSEKKVSEITSIPLSTLRNHRGTGRGIPYIKTERSIRFDLQDIIQFVKKEK